MTLLVLALVAVPAFAQEQVTVVRRDSSRFTGRFEAWARNTNLIYVRVSQNDQQRVPLNDVLVMEVGGPAQSAFPVGGEGGQLRLAGGDGLGQLAGLGQQFALAA